MPTSLENALWGYLERQRLDKWLWHARVVKARTSAAALVEAGHVRINGVREKAPGHGVKLGDVFTIALDNSVRILKVAGFQRAARRRHRGAPAVRGFAGTATVTMCERLATAPENALALWQAFRFSCGSALHALRKPRKI